MARIDYDAYWRDRGFEINRKLKERELIMLSRLPAGSSVIDIGCGNSLLPVKLKEKGLDVAVADISSVVLDGFRTHGIEALRIDLESADGIKLPRSYDYVILSEVLEHVKNPEEILLALKGYAGKFFLTVPNSAFYRYRLHLMFEGRFLRQWVHHPSEHVRFWSHSDFLEWLGALGFTVEWSGASNGLDILGFKLYERFPNLFGHQIVYLCS